MQPDNENASNTKKHKKRIATKKHRKRKHSIEQEKIEPITMIFPADVFHIKLFKQTKKPFVKIGGDKIKVMFLSRKRGKMFCAKHDLSPVGEER
jgi:hypothetical protein